MKKATFKVLALATAVAGATAAQAMNYDLSFNGYGRLGAGYSTDDPLQGEKKNGINVVKAVGSQYQSPGRLGNEGYGFEMGVNNKFTSDNGQVFDVYFMFEDWSQDQNSQGFPQAYVRGSNIFDAQPGASVWAGKRHYGRHYMWQNDYFYLMNDGTGAGLDNLDLGGAMLDFGLVAGGTGTNGRYAFVSQLHGIQLGESVDLGLRANYGFGDDSDKEKGSQFSVYGGHNWAMGRNEIHTRFSQGYRHGMLWGDPQKDLKSVMVGWKGNVNFTNNFGVDYNLLYETTKDQDAIEHVEDGAKASYAKADERLYQFVVTPNFKHNDIHSTRVEFGYDNLKFKDKGTNTAWRVGLEHAIQFNAFGWPSPTLKFYINHGKADTEYLTKTTKANEATWDDETKKLVNGPGKLGKHSVTTVGAMMEASW